MPTSSLCGTTATRLLLSSVHPPVVLTSSHPGPQDVKAVGSPGSLAALGRTGLDVALQVVGRLLSGETQAHLKRTRALLCYMDPVSQKAFRTKTAVSSANQQWHKTY